MKHMTEAEAWREIAKRIAQRGVSSGLCLEIDRLTYDDTALGLYTRRIAWYTCQDMEAAVHEYLGKKCFAYPAGTEPEARMLAALWLAEDADHAR